MKYGDLLMKINLFVFVKCNIIFFGIDSFLYFFKIKY